MLTARDIALLVEAITTAASRHDSQAKAGFRARYHQHTASEMRALGCRLLATPVATRRHRARKRRK